MYLCVMRDLHGWIEDGMWEDATATSVVPNENENESRGMNSWGERGLGVGNKWLR